MKPLMYLPRTVQRLALPAATAATLAAIGLEVAVPSNSAQAHTAWTVAGETRRQPDRHEELGEPERPEGVRSLVSVNATLSEERVAAYISALEQR